MEENKIHKEINIENQKKIHDLLDRYGVKFGIYKNNEFNERIFPYDMNPRIIKKEEFDELEKGLKQRVDALNKFLNDIYSEQKIIKDGIIPEEFVFSSEAFLKECIGVHPSKGVYSHISGIDLIYGKDENWYVLEDNLRVPSGASYPIIARNVSRTICPEMFKDLGIEDNRDYPKLLRNVMDYVNTGGINVVLTPGRYNAAYYEHVFLAEATGAKLVFPNELEVIGDYLYYKNFKGEDVKVGAVYRRISDEFLDPFAFREDSVLGVMNIMSVYKKGNVAIMNSVGNGIADDKGIYYFVPKMIEYYLNEKPILKNAPTYLPFYEDDMKYTLENIRKLVIKDVAEAGGYGVIFGEKLSDEEIENLKNVIIKEPRRFITQEVIDFQELEIYDENGNKILRKADFRAYVLTGESTVVWKSGLTRYTTRDDTFIVNSSQGGGFKDTWVLSR